MTTKAIPLFYGSGCEYPDKLNFVDTNNVFVGVSTSQLCCEHFDWFVSNNVEIDIILQQTNKTNLDNPRQPMVHEGYTFDKDFLVSGTYPKDFDTIINFVVFRLEHPNKKTQPDKFLHLFNAHNGYYAHGFNFKHLEKTLLEGEL